MDGAGITTVDLPGDLLALASDRNRVPFARLLSTRLDLARSWLHLDTVIAETRSTLTPLERALAAYSVAVLNRSDYHESQLLADLVELGTPLWLISNLASNVSWPASDDDRLDVLTMFARKLTSDPSSIAVRDVELLRSVDFTDLDIVDLVNLVGYCNYVNRVAIALGLRSSYPAG